jgi:hypothetical protein
MSLGASPLRGSHDQHKLDIRTAQLNSLFLATRAHSVIQHRENGADVYTKNLGGVT